VNVPSKLAAFGLGLTAMFGAAAAVGNGVGPVIAADSRGNAHEGGHGVQPPDSSADAAQAVPGGLAATRDGYTLRLAQDRFEAGPGADLRFTIARADGRPETDFTPTHDKPLHLIVVGRDMSDFQHVHPRMLDDGSWAVSVGFTDAGAYKVFADFAPAAQPGPMTLAADVLVAGDHQPNPLPAVSGTAVVDGYTVTLDGALEPGRESGVTLSVTKDGQPVTDLQPYLGAYGHLVTLRAGDLAYLHVHPDGEPAAGRTLPGPDVPFIVEVPSSGTYRLYLDFKHDGVVHTAAFTQTTDPRTQPVVVEPTPAVEQPAPESHDSTDHAH